jgi:pyrimidine operon attenuation protein / uracil phosphoribosyltransferase
MHIILSKESADKKLRRMALEVAERNHLDKSIVFIGIKDNGLAIAKKIAMYMKPAFGGDIHIAGLEMDKKNPGGVKIDKLPELKNQKIVVIDDVANSGRTMLYALRPLLEQFPREIQTLALVERTHKHFPVAIDYVGISVSTTVQDHIEVEVLDGVVERAWMK